MSGKPWSRKHVQYLKMPRERIAIIIKEIKIRSHRDLANPGSHEVLEEANRRNEQRVVTKSNESQGRGTFPKFIYNPGT